MKTRTKRSKGERTKLIESKLYKIVCFSFCYEFTSFSFSLMTNKTPLRIKNEPIQNVPPICSPSRIHPTKVPTRG